MELRLLDSPSRLDSAGRTHAARMAAIARDYRQTHFELEMARCHEAVWDMKMWADSQELVCLPYLRLRFHTPTAADNIERFRAWVSRYDYLESYALRDIITALDRGIQIPSLRGMRALQYSDLLRYCTSVSTPVRRQIDPDWSEWNIDTPALRGVFGQDELLIDWAAPQREPDRAMGRVRWAIHPMHASDGEGVDGRLVFGLAVVPPYKLSDIPLAEYVVTIQRSIERIEGYGRANYAFLRFPKIYLEELKLELERRQKIWDAGRTEEPPVPRGRFDRLTRLLPGDD